MGKLGEISLREWCFAPADLGGVPKHLAKEGDSRGQTDSSDGFSRMVWRVGALFQCGWQNITKSCLGMP